MSVWHVPCKMIYTPNMNGLGTTLAEKLTRMWILTHFFQSYWTKKLRSESDDICQFGMYHLRCIYKWNTQALGITLAEWWTRMWNFDAISTKPLNHENEVSHMTCNLSKDLTTKGLLTKGLVSRYLSLKVINNLNKFTPPSLR